MSLKTMHRKASALKGLSLLLDYPKEDYLLSFSAWINEFGRLFPSAQSELSCFAGAVADSPLWEMEELYTRTFDITPICNPYVSAHIYGDENYERGALMHRLKERYEKDGFDTKGELPDHISVLLRFSPCLQDEELEELIEYCLEQPVKEMVKSLEEHGNIYSHVLKAVSDVLTSGLPEERVHD